MSIIKFSHKYVKLGIDVPKRAFLLAVFEVDSSKLHPKFVEYDTLYYSPNPEFYNLPSGKVLVLLFKAVDSQFVFTTIRRATTEKQRYYKIKTGEFFDVQVLETAKK